jgi:PAS domain S-box-containing protein
LFVADTVPALIWQNDADGKNVFVNRAFRSYTGLTDETISGEGWHVLVHPDEADTYIAGYLQAVREQTAWHDRNQIRRHDGSWYMFDNYASPLFGVDGTYLGHVGVSVNVSDQASAVRDLRPGEARASGHG